MESKDELRPVYIENERVFMIDQNRLPEEFKTVEITDWRMMVRAIKEMLVRGAPAIGIAGAYGFYLAAKELISKGNVDFKPGMEKAYIDLKNSRPTAVNLAWAVDKMYALYHQSLAHGDVDKTNGSSEPQIVKVLREEAERIADEDLKMCIAIGNYGADLIDDGDGVITHCNAGGLATGGYGTALGVIRSAHRMGKRIHVFVDETRPRLQGARLTAWELEKEGVPFTLITDSMAGYFMKKGAIQKAVVGADRISSDGDAANKIGTYSLAVLAKEHGIPFYVAAPFSTFDLRIKSGDEIPIEKRSESEVTDVYPKCGFYGKIKVANPAFDVTPAKYISAFITEEGIIRPPLAAGIMELVGNRHGHPTREELTGKV